MICCCSTCLDKRHHSGKNMDVQEVFAYNYEAEWKECLNRHEGNARAAVFNMRLNYLALAAEEIADGAKAFEVQK